MKYHIHIPKLLEFALNAVCDDVTLRGKHFFTTPIPYPLYLRCILTYGDKYDVWRNSLFRFYQEMRHNDAVRVRIGRLYPNVLDHVVLDNDDIDVRLIDEVTQSPLVDDAVASIQRFASRCFAADKSEMMVKKMSQALGVNVLLSKPILDVLLFYGAKLDQQGSEFFNTACRCGMGVDVQLAIENGRRVKSIDMSAAIESGNLNIIKLVHGAYRERFCIHNHTDLINATVQSLELCLSLGIIQREKHYIFQNIPSFSVMQWILDHDVMEHDEMMIDIAYSASRYSGHYFDMLRYLIEQRNFTIPRDILTKLELRHATDPGVFDYLLLHGADISGSENGRNVLEHYSLLIRYWIDKGLVVQSHHSCIIRSCISNNMTVAVLEMMIDKYELNVNATDEAGYNALHHACYSNKAEVVEMLLRHGADVNSAVCSRPPYNMTRNVDIRSLLVRHGYVVHQ